MTAREFVLAKRPEGFPGEDTFRLVERELPPVEDGQVLIEIEWLSVDPYMRSRLRDAPSYAAAVGIGEVMTGAGVGRVIESRNPKWKSGDYVSGVTGWRTHWICDGRGLLRLDPAAAPVSTALGVLGAPGLTAYFCLLDVGKPKAGETVVVSGAAGAVGSVAGQIARIEGCRVVGLAGSDAKCAWLTDELGFDAAINYKTAPDLREALRAACPNGADVYFDNTGGPVTDAVFPLLNLRARVAVCGQISQYNDERGSQGPRLFWHLIVKRARVEGFLILDYAERFAEGRAALAGWLREGKLEHREEIEHGFENTPRAFLDMMRGRNTGKMLVKL